MSPEPIRRIHADHALLPGGWAREVSIEWDADGRLTSVSPNAAAPTETPRAAGAVIPGMPNLHSHAFQRACAGLTEHRGATGQADSFWTWRALMYRFAGKVTPEQLEAIATQLYVEMLQGGYTSVCEFHYLHHDRDGRPYADKAEMSMRLLAAAQRAGIGITLLPVLFQQGGFGNAPPRADQRRFINDEETLLRIVEALNARGARVGVAPHSLRSVGPEALRRIVASVHAIAADAPIHIHIAEQQQEVEDCIAWSGRRPVEWLLANAPIDAHWCLVHATHMTAGERLALAASGAVAGLCPSTEANLGDGVFDAAAYVAAGGDWGIGSDSHVSVDAAEELRWLEYSQRLALQRRNVLASSDSPQVADRLWLDAVAGGARASGRAVGGLRIGEQADFIVLDGAGALAGLGPSQMLAGHVFTRQRRSAVRDVWVGGIQRIVQGEHAIEDSARKAFVDARALLLAEAQK